MKIQILLPTYNRASDVLKNLELLYGQLSHDNLHGQVGLLISDNASPDDTQLVVSQFIEKHPEFVIQYHRQAENIGLEPNAVFCLEKASAPHIVWCGDDDFFADGYLAWLVAIIDAEPGIGVVITGLLSVDELGRERDQRPSQYSQFALSGGYADNLAYSHFGHQLSGLMFRRDGLLQAYLSQPKYRNPYLFVFFTTYSIQHYPGYFMPCYKTRVTTFNAKAWRYNDIGLLDEVFKSYLAMESWISREEVIKLILKFCIQHSYRLSFHPLCPWRIVTHYRRLKKSLPNWPTFHGQVRNWLVKEYLSTWKFW